MPHSITLPTDYMERIERRLDGLETVIKRLLGVIEEKTPDDYVFDRLYGNKKFVNQVKKTIALYKKDKSQFFDPFASYPQQ